MIYYRIAATEERVLAANAPFELTVDSLPHVDALEISE